jgi:Leucine-rich repeat (LRR) protein
MQGITHTGAMDTFRYHNSFGGLTELTVDGYSDMRNMAPLQLLGSLRSFSASDCMVQDAWLTSFCHLPHLTNLNLSKNPGNPLPPPRAEETVRQRNLSDSKM